MKATEVRGVRLSLQSSLERFAKQSVYIVKVVIITISVIVKKY